MPVIHVNRVVDKKRIIGKKEVQGGGGEAQKVADPPKTLTVFPLTLHWTWPQSLQCRGAWNRNQV
jgi:hypothetical protein